jgi:hypothetical protein
MTLKPRGSMPAIPRGMLLIARGRPEGLNCFRDTPRAFLYSLTPGLGILAGAAAQALAEGAGMRALAEIPGTLCVLLAPSVLSYELARLWGREAFWYRYIVAFNWCQWLLPAIGLLLVIGLTLARLAGLVGAGGIRVLIVGLAIYALWLNWFLARHGLALSAGRAVWLVIGVNLGTLAIVFVASALSTSLG